MTTIHVYYADMGPGRGTQLYALDLADAERQALRIGGVVSLRETGERLEVPDPVNPAALAYLQEPKP